MLAKQYNSAAQLSQPPLLVLPRNWLARLPEVPEADERNQLSERQAHEYRRTAKAVAAKPWNLHSASTYLHDMIQK
eukprot:14858470-Alexandrium_andersonii.AAC.1